jgi:hypothetical protein
MAERTALSYRLAGEILRALAEAGGDAARAARAIAGDDELLPRARARVDRVTRALRAASDLRAARRAFAKLPEEYDEALARAFERR